MRKLLILSAAVAGLWVVAVSAPAGAADRQTDGIRNGQAVQADLSARRKHRRYVRRYYVRRYYGGPYYYPYVYYPYAYRHGPYYPYRPYYYRRPGIYFHFGF